MFSGLGFESVGLVLGGFNSVIRGRRLSGSGRKMVVVRLIIIITSIIF